MPAAPRATHVATVRERGGDRALGYRARMS
jgi:hypothetical protein